MFFFWHIQILVRWTKSILSFVLFLDILPSFLSALQPWVTLGLLSNQSPLLSVFRLLYPLRYLHYFEVCYVIHPSRTRSSSTSSYKQSSFHHLPWHRSHFHSLYMSQPSYPLRFYEFHIILSFYGSIQFFVISNSPNVPLLDWPIDPPQSFLGHSVAYSG